MPTHSVTHCSESGRLKNDWWCTFDNIQIHTVTNMITIYFIHNNEKNHKCTNTLRSKRLHSHPSGDPLYWDESSAARPTRESWHGYSDFQLFSQDFQHKTLKENLWSNKSYPALGRSACCEHCTTATQGNPVQHDGAFVRAAKASSPAGVFQIVLELSLKQFY